jgi:8-oxo-dGTP diphosphatase
VSLIHIANIENHFYLWNMQGKNKHELNPRVSTDCVIFGFDRHELKVLLIERDSFGREEKVLALPGDLIYEGEDLDKAAARVLLELTGLSDIYLEQVGAFGSLERLKKESDKEWLRNIREEPNIRVITVAYFSLVNMENINLEPHSFAKAAVWSPVDEVSELAFDHYEIFQVSLKKLKNKIQNQPIGFNLLPDKFTLSQLHKLYEAILGRDLDKRNFRRKMLKLNLVMSCAEKQQGVPHKPSQYYMFNDEKYNELILEGFDNFGF